MSVKMVERKVCDTLGCMEEGLTTCEICKQDICYKHRVEIQRAGSFNTVGLVWAFGRGISQNLCISCFSQRIPELVSVEVPK